MIFLLNTTFNWLKPENNYFSYVINDT